MVSKSCRQYAADRDATRLPRGHVLFDPHVAFALADDFAVQPVVYLVSAFRWSFHESPM